MSTELIFKRILFYIVSFTWGSIMSVAGLLTTIIFLPFGKLGIYHGRIYTEIGENWGGLELGCFFICCKNATEELKAHEAGHGLQNCLWGPLFIFVIWIPSAIRYQYREWLRNHDIEKYNQLPPYDSIWFEGQATKWGLKYVSTDKI